ncbi:MAG TPA: hypothetical protein VGD50_07025 [Candidatus Baltobacteraceae bacterium]
MRTSAGSALIRTGIALLVAWAAAIAPARAADAIFTNAASAIVQVKMTAGDITIQTWDRPAVQIRGGLTIKPSRRIVPFAAPLAQVPILEGRISTAKFGPVVLAQETFVINTIPAGPHDVITVEGRGAVSLTIPQTTPLLVVIVNNRGLVTLRNYHGTLVTRVRAGRVRLQNAGGVSFVQVLRGPITIVNSTFERLRARTGVGAIVLRRCDARQIQVSSVGGSITYDDGTFQLGLAQFESQAGNVALGVDGGADIAAHAGGQVYTLFHERAGVQNRGSDAAVTVGSGGPVVSATTSGGDVFLYDGALPSHAPLPPEWSALGTILKPPAGAAPPLTF